MAASGFDWDEGNRHKCQKHGVSIADIEAMFGDSIVVFPDPVHSKFEERFKGIGTNGKGRHVLIVFTLPVRGGGTFIRPISARYMHRREVKYYEEEIAKAENR